MSVDSVNIDELAANALLTEFNQNQIYHDNIPDDGHYPMICYKDISETPVLHADNKLYGKEHIIRVTVVTLGNSGINELKDKIYQCMVDAGFMWQSTAKVQDDREFYTSLDFSIGNLVNQV